MTETDSKHRNIGFENFFNRFDSVVTGLRITGTIRQKDTIRLHRQHFTGRCLGRNHCQLATAINQHTQDIALYTEVVGNHFEFGGGRILVCMTHTQLPAVLGPLVGALCGHLFGQVHSLETGEVPSRLKGGFIIYIARHNAAVLGAGFTQDTGQLAGIYIGDTEDISLFQVAVQGLLAAEVGEQQRQVADYQAGSPDSVRLRIFIIDADIADMGISEGNYLLCI